MKITNAQLKTLLELHNYLPNEKDYDYLTDDYCKTIIRYESILVNLLQQKIKENEETRIYLFERRNHG